MATKHKNTHTQEHNKQIQSTSSDGFIQYISFAFIRRSCSGQHTLRVCCKEGPRQTYFDLSKYTRYILVLPNAQVANPGVKTTSEHSQHINDGLGIICSILGLRLACSSAFQSAAVISKWIGIDTCFPNWPGTLLGTQERFREEPIQPEVMVH